MNVEECEVCFTPVTKDWQILPCMHKLCKACCSKLQAPKTCPWCRNIIEPLEIISCERFSIRDTLESPEEVIRYERQAYDRTERRKRARERKRRNKEARRNKPRSNSI